MNNKPMIIANDDLSEGVYATGSGGAGGIGTNCWSGNISNKQIGIQGTGGKLYNWYEVHLSHDRNVGHGSNGCTFKLSFNTKISTAFAEQSTNYRTEIQGTDVIVSRIHYADGDWSGDEVTCKVYIYGANDAETLALGIPGVTILKCDRTNTPNTGADT